MARKREFDTAVVLHAAAHTFAMHGYEGTSIDRLVTTTGLKRGSLYQAYGSKAGLFRAALAEVNHPSQETPIIPLDTFKDLLVIALWERSAVDSVVRDITRQMIITLEKGESQSIARILYRRIIARAQLLS